MSEPIAVLISDIHFSVPTLELASQALLKAQFKAKMLGVPLIICGDTLDTKAIMRAECVNALIASLSKTDAPETYILVGNHDLVNEKGREHSLVFLASMAHVVHRPRTIRLKDIEILLVPYTSDPEKFKSLTLEEEDSLFYTEIVICHQGLQGADMGHYIKDTSSCSPTVFDGRRVISGHYHKAQDIRCGLTGRWTYIGNPYTLTFGEANDPEKGYAILMSDGSLERVPLNLRKHVIWEENLITLNSLLNSGCKPRKEDILWIKVHGPASELAKLNKQDLSKRIGMADFKLDKIPDEALALEAKPEQFTDEQLFDKLIDALSEPGEQKAYLKRLWREIV